MSAEIFILSGTRAGEQIVLDSTEFRVGSEPNCEIFFDPCRDLPARGRSALFRLMDDGWYVSCTGIGELLVNQEVICGQTRIRSGDVLRMSNEGPDLCFSIVSRAAAAGAPARIPDAQPAGRTPPSSPVSSQAPASAVPVPLFFSDGIQIAVSASQAPASAIPVPAQRTVTPTPTLVPLPVAPASVRKAPHPSSPSTRKMRPILWASSIGGGLAVIVLLVCAGRYLATPTTVAPAGTLYPGSATDRDERNMVRLKETREKLRKAQEEKKAQDEKEHRRLEQEAWKKREAAKNQP